jgi:hypothetical protein
MANPTLLSMPIAQNGEKNNIPLTTSSTSGDLSVEYGWQAINSIPLTSGGIPPKRLDFNGVLNLLSTLLFYVQKGWTFEFDIHQDYYKGCIVRDTNNKLYECIINVSASNTHPQNDSTHWKLYDFTLPTASPSVKGGIKVGSGLSMAGETLNLNYSLPTASPSQLGGIKVGAGLSMAGGVLSCNPANYIIERGYNANGSWYRKWADGWLEQGGRYSTNSNVAQTVKIDLQRPFASTNYVVIKQNDLSTRDSIPYDVEPHSRYLFVWGLTTTSFKCATYPAQGFNSFGWYACGKGVV